jgi:hypothetical protein
MKQCEVRAVVRLASAISLWTFSSAARAQVDTRRWLLLSPPGDHVTIYVDRERYEWLPDGHLTYWMLTPLDITMTFDTVTSAGKRHIEYRSMVTHDEVDCVAVRVRILSRYLYSGVSPQTDEVWRSDAVEGWIETVPDSRPEKLYRKVCDALAKKRESPA